MATVAAQPDSPLTLADVEAAAARIAGAFPAWSPADGACAQCLTAYADPEEAA